MTLTIDIEQVEHEEINIEELKVKLKDEMPPTLIQTMGRHNKLIGQINQYEEDLDSLTPFQLTKIKHFYGKAEYEAHKLAGYFKAQYQFYNGHALTERGRYYIKERQNGGSRSVDVNDSNYKSRMREGAFLEVAGVYEGYYVTWKGIASAHQGMQTTCRDMVSAIQAET